MILMHFFQPLIVIVIFMNWNNITPLLSIHILHSVLLQVMLDLEISCFTVIALITRQYCTNYYFQTVLHLLPDSIAHDTRQYHTYYQTVLHLLPISITPITRQYRTVTRQYRTISIQYFVQFYYRTRVIHKFQFIEFSKHVCK